MVKSRNKYFNPNPLKHEVGDCVVRAFCKALDKDWDSMYKDLCQIGMDMKAMPSDDKVWKHILDVRDDFIEHSIKIKKGMKRPTADSFANSNKKGTYILSLANHLVTVVDGYHYDTWDCGDKAVYKYWEKVQTK